MWPMIAAMVGGSLLKSELDNQQTRDMNKAQAKAAAAQTQFSPWTGMGAGQFTPKAEGSTLGAGMQGAASGAAMAQSYDQGQLNKQLGQGQLDLIKAQQNYYTGGGSGQGLSAWHRPNNYSQNIG